MCLFFDIKLSFSVVFLDNSVNGLKKQGSYRSGKTGKSQGICLVRESQGKPYNLKTVLEKSGKMNQPANYFP